MTVHRSQTTATPELYARASLMVDGARMPLRTVAESLGVAVDKLAQYVALGRLRASDRLVVLPKGCGPHLAGIVTGAPASMLHVLGCMTCQDLEESMEEGIQVARARWTGQPLDEPEAEEPTAAEPDPAALAASPILWAEPEVSAWAPPTTSSAHPTPDVPAPPAPPAHARAIVLPPLPADPPPPPPIDPVPGWRIDGWGPPAPLQDPTEPQTIVEIDLTDGTIQHDDHEDTDGWSPAVTIPQKGAGRRWPRAARVVVTGLAGTGLFLAGMTWPSLSAEPPVTAVAGAPGITAERSVDDVLQAYLERPRQALLPTPDDVLSVASAPVGEGRSVLGDQLREPAEGSAAFAQTSTSEDAPTAVAPRVDPYAAATWDLLASCESSGNWAADTGNGFYGGLQFQLSSWHLVDGQGMPHEASRDEQIRRAIALWEIQGWPAWPVCSRRLGFR